MGRGNSRDTLRFRQFGRQLRYERLRRISQIALIVAAAIGCNSKKVDPSGVDATAPVTAVAPNLLAESLWRDNQTYVYALELSSAAGLMGALPLAQYEMQGNLVVTARKASGNAVQLAIHLAEPKFRTEKSEAQPMYDALAKELATPYLITLSGGGITEERLAKGTSSFAESILRYLGATLQLRAATGHRGVEATERDGTGVYHASYDSNAEGSEFVRTKLSYDPLPVEGKGLAAKGPTLSTKVKNSKATLKVSDGSLQSIELAESLGSPVSSNAAMSSSTSMKAKLQRSSASVTMVPWGTLVRDSIVTQPGRMVAKPGNASQFDDLRIGNYTFEKALAELTGSAKRNAARQAKDAQSKGRPATVNPSVEKKELTSEERAFTAMTALLRRDAANVERAVQTINKKDVAAAQLMDALSSAGTPVAQQALCSIAENPKLDKTLRQRSAIALGRVIDAAPVTVGTFTRLLHVEGLETAACYGLGTASRRLRESGDFAAADAIVGTLLKELKESKSDDWKVVVLRGIANSGNGKAFEMVEPFLKEPSAQLREAAVEAIRLMQEPRVDTVLQNVLANETDDSVRVAALDACGMRPMTPTLLQTVRSAGLTSKTTRTRRRAIQVLAAWAPENPEAKTALNSIAALETNPNLLHEAQTAEKHLQN